MVIHKDKRYKVFSMRLDEEVWIELKQNRKKSQKSWNQFIKNLNQVIKKKSI